MKRTAQILTHAVMALLLLAGAAWMALIQLAPRPGVAAQLCREITDMTGRSVRLPARPARILSLCTAATDTIVALQAEDRLAAIDEYNRVVAGSEGATVIGKGSAISREQAAVLNIDLAFLWWYQDDAAALLEELAIPVVRIRSVRATEVPAVIRLVGECVDARDAAVGLADQVGLFLAQSRTGPRQEGRKVFLELYGPFKTVGGDSYTTDLLALAGGMNVAAETRGTVVFLAERLVRADPDVILFVGEDSGAAAIASRSGLASLRAVRQGHVAAVHPAWLVAGPSMPRSVERIRGAIFPQQDER